MNEASPKSTETALSTAMAAPAEAASAPVAEPEVAPVAASAAAPAAATGRIGVLLVNLGTPEAADAASVRRYLKEFLTDRRVIEDQGPLWQLVLNGVILPIRART